MAILVWVLIALAIWHFTVFVPDRFLGGIVGAFVTAIVGGVVGGLILSGFDLPSRDGTDVVTVLLGVPGTLVALAILWVVGARRESAAEQAQA
ncbi:hypothetical protein [Patulibacter sp. SYSU D01012]|uniref:hypothetical protein n=1 Tax=Patulibacter sp. SYSU D01012 TaxID=2817381 RepID=UPI001B3023CD|nr:hypothetical protein [Patulibacter sp. SYSU D01012]